MPLDAGATARSFVAAARRGDQKTFDALIDHERMARSLQDNLDSHTGHGAFGQPPDGNCGEYRPVGKRIIVDPEYRLQASEIATLMTEVKRPMSVRRIGADRFDLGFTWTITGFSFVLGKVSGQWRIIAYSSPSEAPIPPQFSCVAPRKPSH